MRKELNIQAVCGGLLSKIKTGFLNEADTFREIYTLANH